MVRSASASTWNASAYWAAVFAVEQDYSRVRTRLLALPSGHAAQLARLKTPQEVHDALYALIVEVLGEELSGSKGWAGESEAAGDA